MAGILARIFGKPIESRALDQVSFGQFFGAQPTASGQYVNPILAENLSTVTACVGAVASTMGSLPAYVYRALGKGREEVTDHPVVRLLRRPNGHQTWPDWMEWTVAQVLLYGNAISAIEYDGAGRPTALIPIPWGSVQVVMLPSGRLAYDVTHGTAAWGGKPVSRRYLQGEVFHLKDRSDDGVIGRSRISRAPDVLGNASALQEWTGSMWKNAATPSGVLMHPKSLSDRALERLKVGLATKFTGPHNARRTMVLEEGLEWKSISVSPEDAEVLASRRFSVEELCRLFQVPPPIVQDYTNNTFTNSQQAALWFAQFSLIPWAQKIQAEFGRSVFGSGSPGYSLEIDLSGLMRGDYEARWKAHEIMAVTGHRTLKEVDRYTRAAAQKVMAESAFSRLVAAKPANEKSHPNPGRSEWDESVSQMSENKGESKWMVPRAGIEPATLRFSVACSTN